jgi:hypothetical protein
MRSLIKLFFAASVLIVVVPGQSLRGPVEGFTFDAPTQSLRAVNGIPGAAQLGLPILTSITYASVAPDENHAVAVRNGDCLFVSGLKSGKAATAAITGVSGHPEGVVWAGNSSLAVLYSFSEKWIQTLSGLPQAPHANSPVELSALSGTFSAVAVDVAGKQIAIAAGGVFLISAGQDFVPIAKMANPIALSFSPDGANLYALDGAERQLAAITIANWNSRIFPLTEFENPIALRAGHDSANQPLVYVVSGKDRLLGVYNPASEKIQSTFRLGFEPTGVEDLGSNSFVIASRSNAGDPLWLFTTAPRMAVYFVPAGQVSKELQ